MKNEKKKKPWAIKARHKNLRKKEIAKQINEDRQFAKSLVESDYKRRMDSWKVWRKSSL